jgi:Cu-Zn family superoxide dismutase
MYRRICLAVAIAISICPAVWAQHKPKHAPVADRTTIAAAEHIEQPDLPRHGVAVFQASKGSHVKGVLQLEQTEHGLRVWGEISGLTPGKHGFHIHEFGDLRSDDGTATGGHYGGKDQQHGDLNADKSHHGDFGNVTANDQGIAKIDLTSDGLHLHFILGRAFVVHADEDDLTSQPSGNAGARIGVALIGVAKAPAKE